MRTRPAGVLTVKVERAFSLRTSPMILPRGTSSSVTEGLGSFSIWRYGSVMSAEGTWRKVRNSIRVFGVRTTEAPLENTSSAVELTPVSTSEPSWKVAPFARGLRWALASMMVTVPLTLPTWTLPVWRAAEERIGRSAKANIPKNLIKAFMTRGWEIKTSPHHNLGNPYKGKDPQKGGQNLVT